MSIVKSIVLGNETLKNPDSVIDSIILGSYAGHLHKRGTENIFLGKNSGFHANGNNNIFIGLNSGSKCQGSGNIILGSVQAEAILSNFFVLGNDTCVPISASLETGDVFIDNLIVKKNITFDGSLFGFLGSNVLERYKTNIGNSTDNFRTITIGDSAGFLNEGSTVIAIGGDAAYMNTVYNVIAIGDSAVKQNTGQNTIGIGTNCLNKNKGKSVIALGENAGSQNIGSNVIFIGNDVCPDNTVSDSLYIGDFITATSERMCLKRDIQVSDWNITKASLSISDTFELTPSNITFADGKLSVTPDMFSFSKSVMIGKNPKRVFNTITFSGKVSQILEIDGTFYGLDEEGYLSYSKEKSWKSLRSPPLKYITKSDEGIILACDKEDVFYRYDSHNWIVENRIDKGTYICKKLVGSYALGSVLSNDFYNEKGTILFRENEEWKLCPGIFEEEFDTIQEWKNEIYLANASGIYIIENRKHILRSTQPILEFVSSKDELVGVFENKVFSIRNEDSIVWCSIEHTFNSDIQKIFWDSSRWVVHTKDGVFVSPLWKLIHEKCDFLSLKTLNYPFSELSLPSSVQLGKVHISEKEGLILNDGLRSGKVYDTEFNPIPVSLKNIQNLDIFLDNEEHLCFDIVLNGTRKLFKLTSNSLC
jgi:hypothetical protein